MCENIVHFRFIVFRPFVGEVLVGTLTSSSSEGLRGNVFNRLILVLHFLRQSDFTSHAFFVINLSQFHMTITFLGTKCH